MEPNAEPSELANNLAFGPGPKIIKAGTRQEFWPLFFLFCSACRKPRRSSKRFLRSGRSPDDDLDLHPWSVSSKTTCVQSAYFLATISLARNVITRIDRR
jgi:hypothetical protein